MGWSQMMAMEVALLPPLAYHKDPKSHATVDRCDDNSDDFSENPANLNDISIKTMKT